MKNSNKKRSIALARFQQLVVRMRMQELVDSQRNVGGVK